MKQQRPPRLSWWQRRWQHWLDARHPPGDQHTLSQRSIYILPTRAGWFLGLTLLILLVASINFQLNLGYLVTFWLLAAAVASVGVAHRNLHELQIQLGALSPVFAGQALDIPIQLKNSKKRARYALAIRFLEQKDNKSFVLNDVTTSQNTALSFTPRTRGWQPLPKVLLQSLYPLGVFRLWSYWQPHSRILAYPQPETPCPPLPSAHNPAAPPTSAAAPQSGQGQHDSVRPYQRGDRLRDIVWKKSAQTLASGSGDLVVRSYHPPSGHLLSLDPEATGLHEREAQLSRLTAWVLQAHEKNHRWELRLPSGTHIATDSGPLHMQRCLQALALEP